MILKLSLGSRAVACLLPQLMDGVLPLVPYLPVAAEGSRLNLELWILGPVEVFPMIKWAVVG